MRLLIAEDDAQLRDALVRGLREQAFAVDAVGDGDAAIVQAAVTDYDALVLDVLMPRRDGLTVCRELRRRGLHTPILLLTARDAVADTIAGLDAGADDYLTKPFAFGELLARLRALLRRRGDVLPPTLAVADLTIDTRHHVVTRAGQRVELTAREYAFLAYLARHAGRVVSRTELATHVWDDSHDPNANLIDVYVSRIRRKVDGGAARALLHTRRGLGVLLADIDGRPGNAGADAGAPFAGDPALLDWLLLNLLDNAVKYSPPGGTVRVALTRLPHAYRLAVADDGPGIAPEAQAHVFERFFRADRARSRTAALGAAAFGGAARPPAGPSGMPSGAGLGLAIARWVAESHGGTLALARSTPRGSEFVAMLPVPPVRPPTPPAASPPVDAAPPSVLAGGAPTFPLHGSRS